MGFMVRACLLALSGLVGSGAVFAQGVSVEAGAAGGTGDGFLMSGQAFFYSDESTLGSDTLNDGSAMFTRFDAQYNMQNYFFGLGLFYEMDKFGEEQNDTITGFILELVAGSFFAKLMPGFVSQKFTGRSSSERTGTFSATEFGIRGELWQKTLFYTVALHMRTTTITEEDGRDMEDAYGQKQTMPMLGMGVSI